MSLPFASPTKVKTTNTGKPHDTRKLQRTFDAPSKTRKTPNPPKKMKIGTRTTSTSRHTVCLNIKRKGK